MPIEVWKTRKFDHLLLQYSNDIYNQNTKERWTKGCIFLFPEKGDPRIAKNYQGITLTSIVAKIYNAQLLNCIKPEIEKILRKNQNGFWRNQSTTSQIWQFIESWELVQKNLEVTLVCIFLQGIWLHTQREDGADTSSVWSPQRNCHNHNDVL